MSSSDSIEASAPTVDQAISQALAQLGAEQDDVTIEVLSTPRSGVLGLGARPARVRVTRRAPAGASSGVTSPPPAPPLRATPPEMRRPEPRVAPPRHERGGLQSPGPSASPGPERTQPPVNDRRGNARDTAPPRRLERSDTQRQEPNQRGGRARSESAAAPPEQQSEPSGEERRNKSRAEEGPPHGRGRGRSRAGGPSGGPGGAPAGGRERGERRAPDATAQRTVETRDLELERDDDRDPFAMVDESGADSRKIADLQEQAREARIFLERILELMGEQATIELAESDDPETLELNIKGDGSGILIGRHGQTLDAIEYMVNRLLARKIKDAAPISIDTESYRARRRRLLQRMALSKGEQAKREHVAVTLDPMPPRDRRIVHLALKDDPMIATRSTGEGFMRAIEIVPVDERADPNERGNENRGRGGRGRTRESDRDKAAIGEQGGFKHGQKRIV